MPSLGNVIPERPKYPGMFATRVSEMPGSRHDVARRCRGFARCSFFPTVNWKLKMLHLASPAPGRSRYSHAPSNTPSLAGVGFQCGVVGGCAPPRAPPHWAPRVFCVYDNNNGTHRIAKRTRWVVPTRRRRADLSDRGRGRRVVGRTNPRVGQGVGGGACLHHARRRVWG